MKQIHLLKNSFNALTFGWSLQLSRIFSIYVVVAFINSSCCNILVILAVYIADSGCYLVLM